MTSRLRARGARDRPLRTSAPAHRACRHSRRLMPILPSGAPRWDLRRREGQAL